MSRIRVSGGLLLRVRESGDPGSGANAPPGPVAGEADAATRREEEPGPPPALLLHGFAATGAFWEPIARDLDRRCLMPDLPGHGASDAPVPSGSWPLTRAADALASLLDRLSIERADVVAYSMGARLALHLLLGHGDRVRRAVLIGASPGIAGARERRERIESDTALARLLEEEGIEAFLKIWEAKPLFASEARLERERRDWMRGLRRASDPRGLAAALLAFGTGAQEPLHERLREIRAETLLVAGGEDAKFRALASEMAGAMTCARAAIVPGAGHNVPLEAPRATVALLRRFLAEGPPPLDGGGGGSASIA